MAKKEKELTNKEHNTAVFAEMKKLQGDIDKLKETLKPVEAIKNATLAECNAMARKKK
jgi:hypothetical protein